MAKGVTVLKIIAWYQGLDKQTLDLVSRVSMKALATGNVNRFVKEMCARELGETLEKPTHVVVLDTEHEEAPT